MSIYFNLSYRDILILEDSLRTDVEIWNGKLNYIRRLLDKENKTEALKKFLEEESWSEEFYNWQVKKRDEQKRVLGEITKQIKMMEKKKFIKVSNKKANDIINTRKPLGLFWTKEKEWFIGIDNSTGEAWVECFKDGNFDKGKKECFKWLSEEE